MKEEIAQAVNNAAQNPKVGAAILATIAGSGTSTILELMPVILGAITNLVAITGGIILIVVNYRQHKKKMKIMDLDEKLKFKELEK